MALLTASQVRERVTHGGDPLDDDDYFTDTWVNERVDEFAHVYASWRGFYPQPTTTTEVLSVHDWTDRVLVAWRKITSVTSVEVAGDALAAADFYVEHPLAIVRKDALFDPDEEIEVTYVHGLADGAASSYVKRACALYVEKVAAAERGGQTADARSGGDVTWFVQPDPTRDRPTGWREVDRLLVLARGQTATVLA